MVQQFNLTTRFETATTAYLVLAGASRAPSQEQVARAEVQPKGQQRTRRAMSICFDAVREICRPPQFWIFLTRPLPLLSWNDVALVFTERKARKVGCERR